MRPADAWLFVEVLRERWRWVVWGGLACALFGFAAASYYWKPGYVASARLIRNESPRTAEVFTYQTLTPQTYVSLLRSPDLLNQVAAAADPAIPSEKFAKRLRLTPEQDGDVVHVELFGPSKTAAMALANLYAIEAVHFTQRLQSNAAAEVRQFVTPQLAQVEAEIATLKTEQPALPTALPTAISSRPSPLLVKLQKAREELVDALTQYMETHPVAQVARARVESLEAQIATGDAPLPLPSDAEIAGNFALQRAAELVASAPPGYYRVLSPALFRDVKGTNRSIKVGAVTTFFALAGTVLFALLALLVEVMDKRLKAPADVTRVTGLPVIATAPDLDTLSPSEQRNWAFRTWKRLQGRLSPTLNHGLVCGVTSAASGEGRSTLVRNLARAASESGFRVLTVSTRHEVRNGNGHESTNGNGNGNVPKVSAVATLSSLPTPMEVERRLSDPHAQPVVHIPLPGWVWNLERRKKWQTALEQWRRIENVVILIELPPACVPEAVLLAEETPNVIWLTDSGSSGAAETRTHLETLRNARCNLIGAVLNHAPDERVRLRFARWLPCLFLLLAPVLAPAQNNPTPTTSTNRPLIQLPTPQPEVVPQEAVGNFLGDSAPTKRAPWQERFTLGPGDVLRIALYGAPEFTRAEAMVAPDGRVGFLEAQDVMAGGRTIDEFRAALDQALGEYRRAPRTMVTPVTLQSKKYCVLGKVKGASQFLKSKRRVLLVAGVYECNVLPSLP